MPLKSNSFLRKKLSEINKKEQEVKALSNEELSNKTNEFKKRLDDGETLDNLLVDVFAVAREATERVLGKRPYDVQMIGGIVLHQGKIAEQKTGEGKTITEIAPAYLNALTGEGVHIVTVNDYLAERDMTEMGKVFKFLGLTVSWIHPMMDPFKKQEAYKADILYGTNKEFGFDYLRDNMAMRADRLFQRKLNFAIIDEVDSILIDDARTPLIISGGETESSELYEDADKCVKRLIRGEDAKDVTKIEAMIENMEKRELTEEEIEKMGDFTVNEKEGTIVLTDRGVKKVESFFNLENLGDLENTSLSHHINQALKANNLMQIDKDYIVKNGEILIIDEFTGRVLDGRRFSDGLHQAIEAKEGVNIKPESRTHATISLQNYFRLYKKIAGMTGTAETEKTEFKDIYNMDVVVIPTNKPVIRIDLPDRIYQTEAAKIRAITNDIENRTKTGQPILVGTPTIAQAERLSKSLKEKKISHNVLTAKNHEKEAEIIAQAGRFGSITIATNMAGRGTDIMLGGNPEFLAKKKLKSKGYSDEQAEMASSKLPAITDEDKDIKKKYYELFDKAKAICDEDSIKVKESGGLHVIGYTRNEARRIDNQLRGRSGRQGDPGSSQFYVSLEDDVIRMFSGSKLKDLVLTMDIAEDTQIDSPYIIRTIKTAQKRYELKNFDIRKNTLEYDDVNDVQRKTIYAFRQKILRGEDSYPIVLRMISEVAKKHVDEIVKKATASESQINELNEFIRKYLRDDSISIVSSNKKQLYDEVTEILEDRYEKKKQEMENIHETINALNMHVILRVVDMKWMDYITALQNLRDSSSLSALGSEKPVDMYKKEAYEIFKELTETIKEDIVRYILNISIVRLKINKSNLGNVSVKL